MNRNWILRFILKLEILHERINVILGWIQFPQHNYLYSIGIWYIQMIGRLVFDFWFTFNFLFLPFYFLKFNLFIDHLYISIFSVIFIYWFNQTILLWNNFNEFILIPDLVYHEIFRILFFNYFNEVIFSHSILLEN